jgi:hypothetical protein
MAWYAGLGIGGADWHGRDDSGIACYGRNGMTWMGLLGILDDFAFMKACHVFEASHR